MDKRCCTLARCQLRPNHRWTGMSTHPHGRYRVSFIFVLHPRKSQTLNGCLLLKWSSRLDPPFPTGTLIFYMMTLTMNHFKEILMYYVINENVNCSENSAGVCNLELLTIAIVLWIQVHRWSTIATSTLLHMESSVSLQETCARSYPLRMSYFMLYFPLHSTPSLVHINTRHITICTT